MVGDGGPKLMCDTPRRGQPHDVVLDRPEKMGALVGAYRDEIPSGRSIIPRRVPGRFNPVGAFEQRHSLA